MKKKQDNIFWLWWNSFFTDFSSEIIKPLLPIYMKILWAEVWLITLFNTLSDFLANMFKIFFWIWSDKKENKKDLLLLWYWTSNFIKPLLYFTSWVFWIFVIEFLNKIWKWLRSVPKEVLMTYSIRANELWKWFWFQKAMDSLWAFMGVIFLTIILYYTQVWFHTIFLLTIIPWLISWYILKTKVINIKLEEVGWKKKETKFSKEDFKLSNIFSLWDKYKKLLTFASIFAIWNIPVVFFILIWLEAGLETYIITLWYAIYTLVDAYFSYILWKISDKKGWSNYLMVLSLITLILANIVILFISFNPILILFISFALLWFYEAWFEWLFKKVIVNNVEKNKVWAWLWLYMGITWVIKILIGILLSIVWMLYSPISVFIISCVFVIIASIYFLLFIKRIND